MEDDNVPPGRLIAIKLIDGTRILAKKFKVSLGQIWIGKFKYADKDGAPVFIEDTMLIGMNAIETYAVILIGGKNEEISASGNEPSAST